VGCQVKGGKSCVYYLKWHQPERALTAPLWAGAAVALHLLSLALQHAGLFSTAWISTLSTLGIAFAITWAIKSVRASGQTEEVPNEEPISHLRPVTSDVSRVETASNQVEVN
jgi:hypothetical protein